jgi:hypothetical protein
MSYHAFQNEYTFRNRFGTLIVTAISSVLNVRDVRGEDFPDKIKFTLAVAERIALITESRHIQIAFQRWTKDGPGYLMIHTSASTVVVVRVKTLDYTGPEDAAGEIELQNRATPPILI